MRERDEELTLFLEMRRREKEKNNLLLVLNSNELDASLGTNGGVSPISKIVSSAPATTTRKTNAVDKFLNSENDKSDYDWLLTPPGTPLFPSLEIESQKAKVSQIGMSNARPTALKPRLENLQEEPASRSNVPLKNPTLSSGLNSSSTGNRRSSSSSGLASSTRAATPTGRPTLTTTAKSSRPSTPTSRATLPSSKHTASAARSSTPTASAVRSSTPAASAARSSTPSRSTARSSTPTARSTIKASKPAPRSATPTARPTITVSKPVPRSATPTSKSTSRSATPTRRSTAPSSAPSVSAPPGRSSSVSKSGSTTSKNPAPSRGTSPSVKSRPWKPSEMPGFSLDAPPNLRTTLPERPASASRGRPGAPSAQSSIDAGSNGRRRQQSCSPSRVRTSNGSARGNGSSIPSMRKVNTSSSDDVSPVQMGTQMVERVVNMRKLAPPKQDYHLSTHNNSAGKSSSSLDSSGFGRTISKKSLDMALRHMDIRRSISGSVRPMMTNIPASSMYSVRSGSTRSRTLSVTDSPLATSSNASSEPSVNNSFFLDESEMEDNHDFGSERGNTSPSSQRGR
ncbi:hypothetical protein ACOSQ2_029598 [Xanthoceras sorbifolium]|uniref:Uncharacterized protein n=1 Tax=Xanthoceras sorbifolium TaxID=99658 RepID=A0ABQ8HBF4_9ROSI|nr:hypothetical protein JRO89_XS12G0062800 [Xanthoceras sorbifolium]